VVCHGDFFSIVSSGSAVIVMGAGGVVFGVAAACSAVFRMIGSGIVFGDVSSGFVVPNFGFSLIVNGNCSLFGIGFVVVLIGVLVKIHLRIMIVTFFTGSSGVTKMSRHEISISFSVETGSKPIMPAERRGLVNPPEKNRPGSIDQSQNYDFQSCIDCNR